MRNFILLIIGLAILLSAKISGARDTSEALPIDSVETTTIETQATDQIIVYYLHMNRRCVTCKKLEAYSIEAIETGFVEQLQDSTVVLRIENFEKEGNEHFAKDYQLYSQSLILSRQLDGKELKWKNLDKIWTLVGNKEEFTSYVRAEVNKFMIPAEEE